MQKKLFFSFVISLFFALSAFQFVQKDTNTGSPRPLSSGFKTLYVTGNFTVTVIKSATQHIEIEGSKDVVANVMTEIKDKELHITWSGNKKEIKETKITIYSPVLEGISVAGSATVISKDAFNAAAAFVNIAGSGSVEYNAIGNDLAISMAGSGDLKMSGNMQKQSISLAGSGDADLSTLTSEESEISIVGSGGCWVNAKNKLAVSIAGSGDVSYKGNPEINQSIIGSGSVNRL
jgi:Putative auto-transporter adhesin, head GIN domain